MYGYLIGNFNKIKQFHRRSAAYPVRRLWSILLLAGFASSLPVQVSAALQQVAPTFVAVAPQTTAAGQLVAAVAQATPPASTTGPSNSGAPTNANATGSAREARHVKVNFYINSISDVNDEAGTYSIDFWLDLFWSDPSLTGKTIKDVAPNTLWQPEVSLINSYSYTTLFKEFDDSLEPDTNVRLSYRFVATLFNKFDLQRFPFDQQTLAIKLESSKYESSAVVFDLLALEEAPPASEKPFIQPIPLGKYLTSDLTLEGWTIDDARIVQQVRVSTYDKSSWSQFQVQFMASRLSAPYLWKIFLVLGFLMLLTWTVLLLDLKELRYRLLLLITLALAMVTFNFTMLQILPRTTYFTVLDRYLLACYSLLVCNTVGVLLIKFLLDFHYERWAVALNRGLLLFYPLLLVIVHLLIIWYVIA